MSLRDLATLVVPTVLVVSVLIVAPRTAFTLLVGGLMVFHTAIHRLEIARIGDASVYPLDLVLVALASFLVYRTVSKRKLQLRLWGPSLTMGAIFAWGLLGTIRGIPANGSSAIGESRWLVLIMLGGLCFMSVFRDKRDMELFLKHFTILTVIMLVFDAVGFYLLGGLQMASALSGDSRLGFRFISAHQALLVAIALVRVALLLVHGKTRFWRAMPTIIVFAAVVVVTQHRSAWIALLIGIAGVVFDVVVIRRRVNLRTVALTALVTVGLMPLLAGVVTVSGDRILESLGTSASFLSGIENDRTGSWRLSAWRQGISIAMQHPVLGEGLGSYMRWHDGHQWQRVFVHNEYLTRFAKFGVVGLLLLLVFLYQCYKHLLGHMLDPRSDARLLATSAAVFIAMMLGFSLFYEFGIFFWVFASLGVSIARTTPSVETAEVPYVP